MNPGEHLFAFVTKDQEWKWIVRPDDVRSLSAKAVRKYLVSLQGTLSACEDQIKDRKVRKLFFEFGDRLYAFAEKHARKSQAPST